MRPTQTGHHCASVGAHLLTLVADDGLRGSPLRRLAVRERAAVQAVGVVRQPIRCPARQPPCAGSVLPDWIGMHRKMTCGATASLFLTSDHNCMHTLFVMPAPNCSAEYTGRQPSAYLLVQCEEDPTRDNSNRS